MLKEKLQQYTNVGSKTSTREYKGIFFNDYVEFICLRQALKVKHPYHAYRVLLQPTVTCSKLTIETLE